jgi:nicotinamidase-related amidase
MNTEGPPSTEVTLSKQQSLPRSLLEIAGARWQPARISEAALVIVDAQREYTDGCLPLPGVADAIASVAVLLDRARGAGSPVVHVVQHGRSGGPICDPNGAMVEIVSALAPRDGEVMVVKRLPNSFAGTALGSELQRIGRKDLIVVGFMTHMCVSATVRAALDHGYRCTMAADCCGSRDLPDGAGGVIPAALVHGVELAALRDRFAAVVARQQDLFD